MIRSWIVVGGGGIEAVFETREAASYHAELQAKANPGNPYRIFHLIGEVVASNLKWTYPNGG